MWIRRVDIECGLGVWIRQYGYASIKTMNSQEPAPVLIFQRLLYYTLCHQSELVFRVWICEDQSLWNSWTGSLLLSRRTKGMNKGTREEAEEKLYREGPVLCQELWEGERCYSCHKVEVRGLEISEWFSFGLFIKRRAGRPSYLAFSSRHCCKHG